MVRVLSAKIHCRQSNVGERVKQEDTLDGARRCSGQINSAEKRSSNRLPELDHWLTWVKLKVCGGWHLAKLRRVLPARAKLFEVDDLEK